MAVKSKFHKGDRVLVTGVHDSLYEAVGKEGTVKSVRRSSGIYYDTVVVQFDERFSDRLHSGGVGDLTNRCWNYADDKLTLALSPISVDDVDSLL